MITGTLRGITMLKNMLSELAPSIFAASMSEFEIASNEVLKSRILNILTAAIIQIGQKVFIRLKCR